MTVKELLDVINRFDHTIELRTGNEWYNDIVEKLPRIHNANDVYAGDYADYGVCNVEATDYLALRVWIYPEDVTVNYKITTYSQVLLSGTWEDGEWDWKLTDYPFETRESAEKFLEKITITKDLSMARLYKVRKYEHDDEMETTEELLIEKS